MENSAILISVIVLTKNDENTIRHCLESLTWCDEIIVVDNGSTDLTLHIVKMFKAKVLSIIHSDLDFSELRNQGMKHARGKWLLYVDSDEIVPQSLRDEILHVIYSFNASLSEHSYFINRQNYYFGILWPVMDAMQRLFLRKSLKHWYGRLHESPISQGRTGNLKHGLIHNTHRTLEEMVDKTNDWSIIEAKLRYDAFHPPVVWWRFLRVAYTGFADSFLTKGGWKAGLYGWIESIYQGYSMIITYAKLWEMQQSH